MTIGTDIGKNIPAGSDATFVPQEVKLGTRVKSDGSTASYYELPEGAVELQDIISAQDMNAQMGEIGRAWKRYGMCSHSDKLRDIKKIIFYAFAEKSRLERYENE